MFKFKDALVVIAAILGVAFVVFCLGWCQAELDEGDPSGCRSYSAVLVA